MPKKESDMAADGRAPALNLCTCMANGIIHLLCCDRRHIIFFNDPYHSRLALSTLMGLIYEHKHILHGPDNFRHSAIECLSFNAKGTLLASGDEAGRLLVWSVASGKLLDIIEGHSAVLSIVWTLSERSDAIMVGFRDGLILTAILEKVWQFPRRLGLFTNGL